MPPRAGLSQAPVRAPPLTLEAAKIEIERLNEELKIQRRRLEYTLTAIENKADTKITIAQNSTNAVKRKLEELTSDYERLQIRYEASEHERERLTEMVETIDKVINTNNATTR